MHKKPNASNVETVQRRKHWRDRRVSGDRRTPERLHLTTYDCRSGQPRRESDLAGELSDGDVWWDDKSTKYE